MQLGRSFCILDFRNGLSAHWVRWGGLGPAGCIPDGVMQSAAGGVKGDAPFGLWAVGENDVPLAGAANDSRFPVMAGQRG